jgi:signal peptidase I
MLGSVQSLLVTVVIAIFVIVFLVQAFQIPSESMENTLLIGDYLLVDKVHYGSGGLWGKILPYRPIQRGDIVVFHYPVDPHQHFVKRVIALPGDRVRMAGKQVWVNDVPLTEPYARFNLASEGLYRHKFPDTDFILFGMEPLWWKQMQGLVREGELIVPKDNYFVLGDNRDQSLDSRYWGFVPQENVVGRPLIIYWSLREGDTSDSDNESPSDKLAHFAYLLTHVFQTTRWDRTLRFVR